MMIARIPGWYIFLFFLSINATIPLIEKIEIKGSNNAGNMIIVTPNTEFKREYVTQNFFVKYGDPLDLASLDESQSIIPFIGSVIHIIWASGNKYTVRSLDKDYYYALKKIKEVFRIFYPQTDWSGELVPDKLVNNNSRAHLEYPSKADVSRDTKPFDTSAFAKATANTQGERGGANAIAILFSGGLDAVGTSFSHLDKQQLLITIRGRDVTLNQDGMWANIKKQCKTFAQIYGHTNSFVASNFHAFINHEQLRKKFPTMPYWGDTSQSLCFSALAFPLLIQHKISTVVMGSSNTIECPFAYGSHPLIDNNIQMSGIQVHYDRPDLTRIGKLDYIVKTTKKNNLPKPTLRVCWGNDKRGGNCYKCEKCIRTMNLILALGEDLHAYGFFQTVDDVRYITQKYFSSHKKKFLKFEVAWDWECVQQRIAEILNDPQSEIKYTPEVKNYLEWFITIPLDTYCYDSRITFEENKQYFKPLWAAAEHGPIDLETIKSFSSKGTL